MGEGGFSRTRFANDPHRLACLHLKGDLFKNGLTGKVAKARILKAQAALYLLKAQGVTALHHVGSGVHDLKKSAHCLDAVCRLGDHKPKKVNCRIICATNQNPMDPEFKQAARRAYDLLLEDEACAAYLRELDDAFSL